MPHIPRAEKTRNKSLVRGERAAKVRLSLRREEWDAIRRIGRRWFGKEGDRYTLTIPRIIDDFYLSLHAPPAKGTMTQTVELRERDRENLQTIAQLLGLASPSEVLRALIYRYPEAPVSLFVKPDHLPYKRSSPKPHKSMAQDLAGLEMTDEEWEEVCRVAQFESFQEAVLGKKKRRTHVRKDSPQNP